MDKMAKQTHGFTIIEMMVVILVLGILIAMSVFSYTGWKGSINQREVQSDLRMAATSMESAKNFSDGYPSTIPASFKPSENVSIIKVWGDKTQYCMQARNLIDSAVVYFIRNGQTSSPQPGVCPTSPLPPSSPSPTASAASSSSFVVSWPNVSGATSYTLRYGTGSPTTVSACTSSPCTVSGLSASTTYNISVVATNAAGSSVPGTTSVVTVAPAIPAPAAAGISYTGPTRIKKSTGEYAQRYVVTTSGGACSVGATEWKIGVTGGSTPYWAGETWQSSNTRTVDVLENGIYSPYDVTIFAKPRCVSGGNSTEGNAVYTYNGSGGGGPGGSI